ncbi:hypothetical protein GQF40_11285, partial [Neisseria meningitidis]|nr:hypothetical protein [Neisseria meningitidis]MBG9094111.1 hypothetical protein [Neisseria meningitidis]
LNLNQDKATKPQTVQIVRQGEATLYWFKFNPLYQLHLRHSGISFDSSPPKPSTQSANSLSVICNPVSR